MQDGNEQIVISLVKTMSREVETLRRVWYVGIQLKMWMYREKFLKN